MCDSIVAGQCPFEHASRMTAKESLGLYILLIDATPRSPEQQIGNVPWLQALPVRNLGSSFVFLRA
jgi:hypothetical protein